MWLVWYYTRYSTYIHKLGLEYRIMDAGLILWTTCLEGWNLELWKRSRDCIYWPES